MIKLEVKRLVSDPNYTEGKLYLNGEYVCDTLELPWLDNESDVSCIPLGTYLVRRRTVGKFARAAKRRWKHGYVLWVIEVEGRKYILIHWGNDTDDTLGCILVGKKAADGLVYESRTCYEDLWNRIHQIWTPDEGFIELRVSYFEKDSEFHPEERRLIDPKDL